MSMTCGRLGVDLGQSLKTAETARGCWVKARLLTDEWTAGAYRSMVEDEKPKKQGMKVCTPDKSDVNAASGNTGMEPADDRCKTGSGCR